MLLRAFALLALSLLVGLPRLSAQEGASTLSVIKYWETCPDFLSEQKDLVLEELKTTKKLRLPQEIYGGMTLLVAEDKELSLRTSSLSLWTLRVLPLTNGGYILAVITTVEEPTADSQLHFYSPGWKPLKTGDYFTPPKVESFFAGGGLPPELKANLSPLYTRYTFDREGRLSVKLSVPTLLDDASRDALSKQITSARSLPYVWQSDRFRPSFPTR